MSSQQPPRGTRPVSPTPWKTVWSPWWPPFTPPTRRRQPASNTSPVSGEKWQNWAVGSGVPTAC